MKSASARAVAWARSARARDRLSVFGGAALLLLVFCAMRTWFLARSWTLFVERVYRRDEPMLLSWLDARVPSRAIFRGVLLFRLALLALHAGVFGWIVLSLSRLPEGGAPLPQRTMPCRRQCNPRSPTVSIRLWMARRRQLSPP